jgi:hypothetical protein
MADNPLLITDSDIDGVLKRVQTNFRAKSFPILTPLLAQVKKGKAGGPERMRFGGSGVFWDVVLSRPVGMAASQSGYFPPSAEAVEKQATLGIKRTYVRRQVDRLSLLGTASKEAAFIPLAKKIAQEAIDASRLGQQEILQGNGTAVKALITVVNSTTSIDVSSPYGVSGAGEGGLLLDVGMYVAVLDTGSADAVLGRATITAVVNSGDTAVVTLDTAIAGMAATDKLVPCTESDTSFNAYPNGLINITNRGGSAYDNFEGINAATYPRWDSTQFVAGTDTPDVDQLHEYDIDKLAQKVRGLSGKDAKSNPGEFLLITTPGLERNLAQSFVGQRQHMMGEMELKGGFKAVTISGIPLISDFWVPAGTVYLVHVPSLTWIDLDDWAPVSHEGAGPWRFIAGRDAYEWNIGAMWNFGALVRNTHGSITGYTDSERYSHVK